MHDIIQRMVHDMDAETKARGSRNTMILMGDQSSRYLRCVEHRAKALGLRVVWPDQDLVVDLAGEPVCVFDTECQNPKTREIAFYAVNAWRDIDNIVGLDMSCCAEAAYEIIKASGSCRSLVGITGRGHAVRGLDWNLKAGGYSTIGVHSQSARHEINLMAENADIIVHSSKEMEWDRMPGRFCLVLDVCGTLGGKRTDYPYIGAKEIGALNISILLHRFVGV